MEYQVTYKNISKTNLTKVALSVKCGAKSIYVNQVDLSKEDKREQFIDALIKKYKGLESEKDNISKRLLEIADELLTTNESEDDEQQSKTPLEQSEKELAETDQELIDAAEKFLKTPELIQLTIKHIELLGLVGEQALGLALYLTFTSRLLSKPLASVVLGASCAGKSYAISLTGKLFPPEYVYNAHRITPTALSYLPKGSLIHRAVIAGERSRKQDDDQAEATRALREMISDGVLRIMVTGKDGSGNMTTHHIEQPGPIAYAESTTLGISGIFDEDKTRFLFLCCDESEAQSKRIIERLATESQSPMKQQKIDSIISLHHTVQRLLKPYNIAIPFANQLTACLPVHKPECRRAFGHLLSLIRAAALMHQYQRDKTEDDSIIATLDDYEVVRQYLTQPIARGLGVELTAGAAGLLEHIESHYEIDNLFTAHDLREETGIGKVVYDRMKELRHHGYIKIKEPGAGNIAAKYCRNPYPTGAAGLELPDLKKSDYSILSGKAEANDEVLI
jgi:hypothetical protein